MFQQHGGVGIEDRSRPGPLQRSGTGQRGRRAITQPNVPPQPSRTARRRAITDCYRGKSRQMISPIAPAAQSVTAGCQLAKRENRSHAPAASSCSAAGRAARRIISVAEWVLGIADDFHAAAISCHHLTLGNGFRGVVGALGLNVRTKLSQQPSHVQFRENHHRVDVRQCRQDFRTLYRRSRASLRPYGADQDWSPLPATISGHKVFTAYR